MANKVVYDCEEVQDEINSWDKGIRAVYTRIVGLMEKYGPNVGMPFTKAFGEGLFEIRAKKTGRAFFCMKTKEEIVILHAFIKRSRKTPKKDVDLAKKRMKKYKK